MAAHVSNFNQANNKIVLDLINEQNSATITTPLTVNQVTLGAPTVVGEPGSLATSLTVTGVTAEGFKGSVDIAYNRVNLNFMNPTAGDDLYVEVTNEENISDIIGQLNARFGILLTAADFTDGPLPAAPAEGQVAGFNIVANPTSLVWAGQVRVVRIAALTELSTLIAQAEMDGLYAPT